MTLRDAVLAVLREKPAYALQVVERVEALGLSVGMDIYSMLRRLEREGLVESYEVAQKPRRYYRIAREG